MKRPLCIGLTGGIGSGKSTACDYFRELGVPVIDADVIARDLVTPGSPALDAIVDEFGTDLLDNQGALDRGWMRQKIFSDRAARKKLESLLHPQVYEEIGREIENITAPYCIVSVPLLLETNSSSRFDRILVIDVSESLQLQRASHRDGTEPADIQAIIDEQITRDERLARADDIINNDGDPESLKKQVSQYHEQYCALSRKSPETVGQK